MSDAVCLHGVNSYDLAVLSPVIEAHFTALQVPITKGMTVVLKPNLVIRAAPESGVITHPNFVAAVGLAVKRRGANVLIAESSGGPYTPNAMKAIYAGCGYTEMAKQHGFSLYTDCQSQEVRLPQAKLCHRLHLVTPFVDADYIINLPKLKSHCMTLLSGAVKNLFGTVPGLMKPELHCRFPEKPEFCQMLVDLCERVRPNLCMMDAIDAMEGDGPTGGSKRFVGAVISSLSPYRTDLVAATLIGMDPAAVHTLAHAAAQGLCPSTAAALALVGDKLSSLMVQGFKMPQSKDVDFISRMPRFLQPLTKKIATPRPVIQKKSCVGCGKCAESCPRHTIRIANGKASIDYSDCIHCFCCHEMCPLHVIDVKRFSIFNL